MKTRIFIIITIFSFSSIAANAGKISGRVHAEGKGLKNVVISDGISCTLTDADGNYTINTDKHAEFIFVSTPSGYLPENKNSTLPLFYKRIRDGISSYDFGLKKNEKDDNKHMFIVQTDVQMANESDLDLYKKLLPAGAEFINKNRNTDIFGFDCGDITGDNLGIIPGYIDAVSILNIPIYRAIGNHDMDYNGRSHETSYKSFENTFGPVYYSFNRGKAHYIVLNNTFFIGREYFYMGYIDEKTFSWLEQDLSYVEKESPVFVLLHIPTRLKAERTPFTYTASETASQTINAQSLYKLLEPYRANIISGHIHSSRNIYHNDKLFEHNTPAVSGAWWQGDICLDGTPQGYGVYYVDNKDVRWHFKAFLHDKEYQFKSYPPGTYKEYPNDIIVNVWNWDPLWKVEWIENGQSKGNMEQFEGLDADAIALCSKNLKYSWISPEKTNHLFKATPSKPNADILIKVTDRFGNVFEQKLETIK